MVWKIFNSRNKTATKTQDKVSEEVISGAYKTREKEIESLRKYDRGEKTITPSNLRKLVQSL
jgi:hypothetical protein